ncbi:unnamed protein product [Vicia faba]|uniref:Dof-type domain-containing protein n=1 Tax=Vicia faba TaxID=3906 RepID=A0AAV0YT56_VICFA|nr:unnamed protein product [Vicia faba]
MSEKINVSTIKLFGRTIFITHNTDVLTNDSTQQNSTKLDDQSDMSQDKSPMKPDMIVPCPRCKSMETKFRYYNNFKVKQPRHFCKNCQRYWTSGGTARKMLVGAGRRKNKFTNFPLDVLHYSQMSNVSSTSPDKNLNVGSYEETFDKSYQSLPPQFSWNPAICYPNKAYYGGFLQPFVPTQSCGPSQPTLRKHSRDGDVIIYSNSEKEKLGLKRNKERHDSNEELVPKLLRVDYPNDVVMSSIWSTIGIENGRGIFKGFGSNCDDKNHIVEASSSVLKVNPAVLPSSIVFHVMI